jgi:hypothetical protein
MLYITVGYIIPFLCMGHVSEQLGWVSLGITTSPAD